jgi:transcriptional regulator with XRE-family HTH domain
MTDGGSVQRLLREQVAEEVRALLARKMMTGADVATAMKKSPMYVSRRIRGEVAFDLDDIQAIAEVLGVEIGDLFPHRGGRANRDFEVAPAERAVTIGQVSVDLADGGTQVKEPRKLPHPFSQAKPGHTRPVSAVPARKRRPMPVGPAARRGQRS